MTISTWLVLIAGTLNLCILRISSKFSLYLFIVSFWWLSWLFIATTSLSSLKPPELNTVQIFLLMLYSVTLGSSIFRGWYSVFFSRKILLKGKSRKKKLAKGQTGENIILLKIDQ
jgi:hypothetical protein